MNADTVNSQLSALYADWKVSLHLPASESTRLGLPFLMKATDAYCSAERRVLVIGQETFGWQWNSELQATYPHYPTNWPYADLNNFGDFAREPDAVAALCCGYGEFAFAARQPALKRTPFWQGFAEVSRWPDVALMWGNLVHMDYASPKSMSILWASAELKEAVIAQQAGLMAAELKILAPDVCLFFTGPNYDGILQATLPSIRLLSCSDVPARQLARIDHPSLPASSFRTYHPGYLNRAKKWHYIEVLRDLAL